MHYLRLFFSGLIVLFTLGLFAQDGILDETFSEDGLYAFRIGADYYINDAILLEDGKIMIVGRVDYVNSTDVFVMRLNENGTLDPSFQTVGFAAYDITSAGTEWGREVHVLTCGNIIISGTTDMGAFLMQLLPDGAIDKSFGSNGISKTNLLRGIEDIVIVPAMINTYDILAAGSFEDGINSRPGIIRFTENGAVINSFGNSGIATLPAAIKGVFNNIQINISVSTIYAQGTQQEDGVPNDNALFAKFNTGGRNPSYFTVDGPAVGNSNNLRAIFPHPDGSYTFCGEYMDSTQDGYVCRILPNADLDIAFGDSGYRYNFQTKTMRGLAIQPDGKILLGGTSDLQGTEDFTIIRLSGDGADDHTFGTNSYVLTDFGIGTDRLRRIMTPGDGKLVAVGNTFNNDDHYITVAKYLLNHTLDKREIEQEFKTPKVYPNPTRNSIFIEFPSQIQRLDYYKIYDIHGTTIKSDSNISTSDLKEIDMSNEDAGYYIMQMTIDGKNHTKRFILL